MVQTNNKLHSIKPKIGITHFGNQLGRREEQILHRLRIGHTHLTHAFILQRDEKPICSTCNCPITVEYILLTYTKYDTPRSQYFKVSSLKELFEKTSSRHILDFINDIDLCKKI